MARPAGGRSWGKPNPIDVHVGNRLRLRRTLLGMSQQKVGEALGLTFQQVQKYERGTNRIGASRLWDLAGVLDCPVSFFFDEMDEKTAGASPRNWDGQTTDIMLRQDDPMNRRETLELVRAYYRIKGYHVRRRIYELAKSLASAGADGEEADWKSDHEDMGAMPMNAMTPSQQEMRKS
ncbi:MAG: helix-turn-helix transcriptional regulator [Rhodospirillaceae bacterium]|nr:helix-turn-helix transcriptional regulator [Rhodospirillaceae bacterium]